MFNRAFPIGCLLTVIFGVAHACDGPRELREATAKSIETFIDSKHMTELTFAGYSGARYENAKTMLEQASIVLDGLARRRL